MALKCDKIVIWGPERWFSGYHAGLFLQRYEFKPCRHQNLFLITYDVTKIKDLFIVLGEPSFID